MVYAVKKVLLRKRRKALNARVMREVTTLSRLSHPHIVRYFQAWLEELPADAWSEGENSESEEDSSEEDMTETQGTKGGKRRNRGGGAVAESFIYRHS